MNCTPTLRVYNTNIRTLFNKNLHIKPNPTMMNILYMHINTNLHNSMHNHIIVKCTQYLDKQSLTGLREITHEVIQAQQYVNLWIKHTNV